MCQENNRTNGAASDICIKDQRFNVNGKRSLSDTSGNVANGRVVSMGSFTEIAPVDEELHRGHRMWIGAIEHSPDDIVIQLHGATGYLCQLGRFKRVYGG